MVAFGQKLLEDRSNEWQPYYVNYHRLKDLIRNILAERSDSANEAFKEELSQNMKRVDSFYLTQEQVLVDKVKSFQADSADSTEEEIKKMADAVRVDLAKLAEFADVNYTGLRKITKKFDKKVAGTKKVSSSSKSVDAQDVKLQGLMQHMIEVMDTYPFASARNRLGSVEASLEEWISTKVWNEPELGDGGMRRQRSLVVPLIEKPHKPLSRHFIKAANYLKKRLAKSWLLIVITLVILVCYAISCSSYGPLVNGWTGSSYVVVWVTMVALVLLPMGMPADGVLMSSTLFLTICGILTPTDAWAAFSNDVVLSVAGLGCIAQAVESTGIIDIVFLKILGNPRSVQMAMLRLFIPAMVLNVCISNTCVMSCLLPVLEKWSIQIGIHKAFFLMPLSYILLISGVFAIFSTSTNLIAQGLLLSHGEKGFDNFALAIPVLICSATTILYLLVATPYVLKRFGKKGDDEEGTVENLNRLTAKTYDMRVQITGKVYAGKTLESSGILGKLHGGISDAVACWRYGVLTADLDKEFELQLDDVILLNTSADGIVAMRDLPGILLLPLDSTEVHAGEANSDLRELVEVVLDTPSTLVGHRLVNSYVYFDRSQDCSIVAYHSFRDGNMAKELPSGTMCRVPTEADTKKMIATSGANPQRRLVRGDHIVFDAPKSFYRENKHKPDFVTVRRLTEAREQVDLATAYTAGVILLGMIILVAGSILPLLEAVLLALGAVVLTDCAKLDSVRKSVKLSTVLTIVGAFGLGKAIGQQNVADALADLLLYLLAPFGTVGLLFAIYLATVGLGVVFHGTAVVVLMFPVCKAAADSQSLPLHMVVAVLCLAVSMQVLSPISYQTNMMAFGAGGYEFTDFTKLGSGLVCIIGFVCIPLCQYWYAV